MDKERLRSAIKEKDGWWASIFSGPLANRFLEPICEIGFVTPNLITIASFGIGVLASLCFLKGTHFFLILGAILVQLSFIVDCMDGQLARYRQQFSDLGAWLDRVSDRIKDFLYFFCLAFGYFNRNVEYNSDQAWLAWPLAMIAFFAVFLIDYYVNQDVKLKPKSSSSNETPSNKEVPLYKRMLVSLLKLGLKIYRAIPILRFNIGEQALLISIFCMLNAVMPLLVCFALLGSFYVIYWPVAKFYGYTESK